MRKTLMITAVLVAVVAVAGCGETGVTADPTPAPVATVGQGEPTQPADTDGNSTAPVREYIDALAATDNPSAMRDGLKHTRDGSVAHTYLAHRANLAEAFLDGGFPLPAYRVTEVADGYKLCDPADRATCGTFAGFKADGGKLTDLTVDGERPGPLLTVGNGDTVTAGGVTAEFLTAYDTISDGSLWVTVQLTSGGEPAELDIYGATYRAPDGKQRQATDAQGPFELGSESNAKVVLVFADVEPGGTVTMVVWDMDFNESTLEIQVG